MEFFKISIILFQLLTSFTCIWSRTSERPSKRDPCTDYPSCQLISTKMFESYCVRNTLKNMCPSFCDKKCKDAKKNLTAVTSSTSTIISTTTTTTSASKSTTMIPSTSKVQITEASQNIKTNIPQHITSNIQKSQSNQALTRPISKKVSKKRPNKTTQRKNFSKTPKTTTTTTPSTASTTSTLATTISYRSTTPEPTTTTATTTTTTTTTTSTSTTTTTTTTQNTTTTITTLDSTISVTEAIKSKGSDLANDSTSKIVSTTIEAMTNEVDKKDDLVTEIPATIADNLSSEVSSSSENVSMTTKLALTRVSFYDLTTTKVIEENDNSEDEVEDAEFIETTTVENVQQPMDDVDENLKDSMTSTVSSHTTINSSFTTLIDQQGNSTNSRKTVTILVPLFEAGFVQRIIPTSNKQECDFSKATLCKQQNCRKDGVWCPMTNDIPKEQIEILFNYTSDIYVLETQGRVTKEEMVTNFLFQYLNESGNLISHLYKTESKNSTAVSKFKFDPPLRTNYIRITPLEYENSIAMRFELYSKGVLYIPDSK